MADVFRYRYGETSPTQYPYKPMVGSVPGVAIAVGDLVYRDVADADANGQGYLKPANSLPWDTNLGQTQIDFVASFCGVSAQRWDGTNVAIGVKDGFLRVDTTGVFDFACAAGSTFKIGDLVGPDQTSGGVLSLQSQQVVKVSAKNQAVGRVEREAANVSLVRVRIFSTNMGVVNN